MDALNLITYFFFFVSLYMELFLLVNFFEKKKEIEKEEEGLFLKDPKSVTIIVPCWNEEKTLEKTVDSLLNLDYPQDKLFVFIVDDGSTDNTWEVMQKYKDHPQVRLFRKENGGKYTALNLGLKYIETEFVGCLDADSFVEKDALARIMAYFEDPEVMAVTPALRVYKPSNFIELIQHTEYKLSIFLRKMFGTLGALFVTPGPLSVFRKKVFEELGPYRHAHGTEDLEMALRMQSRNYKIENSHLANVYTVVPRSFRALYRQRVRWVTGFLKNAIDYRHLFFSRRAGNLGFLILPASVISVFSGIYFLSRALFSIADYLIDKIYNFYALNFDFSYLFHPKLDWFFINTSSLFFLTMVLLSVTIIFVLTGQWLADKKIRFSRSLLYYLLFYGFLAPIWLARSLYNTFASKAAAWR